MIITYDPIIVQIEYPLCKPLLRCYRTHSIMSWINEEGIEANIESCIREILAARYYGTEAIERSCEYCEESQEKKDGMSFEEYFKINRKGFKLF